MKRKGVFLSYPMDVAAHLPDIVWYLTQSGTDMWCRRPYGFFFTSRRAASEFATAMGSAFDLVPIGVEARELVSDEGLRRIRSLHLTRLFVDPKLEANGDVAGRILRLEALPKSTVQ
jgi:hypothetical protein